MHNKNTKQCNIMVKHQIPLNSKSVIFKSDPRVEQSLITPSTLLTKESRYLKYIPGMING